MPHHHYSSSGATRSKRSKKDVAKMAPVAQQAPQSRAKTSKGSPKIPRKEVAQAQPRSQSDALGIDRSQKTPAAPQAQTQSQSQAQAQAQAQPAKTPEPTKTLNVFDFLQEDDSDDPDVSDDESLSQDDKSVSVSSSQVQSVPILQPTASHADRGYPVSPAVEARCIPEEIPRGSSPSVASSVVTKASTDIPQPHTPPDVSPAAAALQLTKAFIPDQTQSEAGTYSTTGSQIEGSISAEKPSRGLSSIKETYYGAYTFPQHAAPPLPTPPPPPRSPGQHSHRSHRKLRKKPKPHSVTTGYGFLASRLSPSLDGNNDTRLPPLYRRFENLNHRVLLHLQDEIAQMEEDLRMLDEYEEMHRVAIAEQEGTKTLPASRRMDVQSQFYSSLHYRRLDLMEALVHKTEQYNNALSAYNKVLQTLTPASEKDINTYRIWMKEKRPIAAAETRFLEYNTDLISLNPTSPRPTSDSPNTTTPISYSPPAIASAAILIPLLTFGMVSEFSARLVIVTVINGTIAANCLADLERLVDSHEGWKYAAMYFGFMITTALIIP